MTPGRLPALLQRFFSERLPSQMAASPHTMAAYRDTFRLLLRYVAERRRRGPSELDVDDIDAGTVGRFLDHLESRRGNGARTRNARLAAVRSFFRYVAMEEPGRALLCQQILAIPRKRHERRPVEFLSREESAAILAAPDTGTWIGRRDRTLLLLALQTGLRNSEIRSLACCDVTFDRVARVRCTGKGRKRRETPLRSDVAAALKAWLRERRGRPEDALFPSSRGGTMSPDALARILARACAATAKACPSLARKSVTPHTLRHTAAMDLLHRGIDITVIALWLGHESTESTEAYVHADMRLKERALGRATDSGRPPTRYRPPDRLLAFLESL